jgi:hypothetical protein
MLVTNIIEPKSAVMNNRLSLCVRFPPLVIAV